MNTTINYYNLNAKNFIENTQNADMHLAQEAFLQLLPGSASILDFGCGSGRDTKYFLEKGTRWRQPTDPQNSVDWQVALQGLK